MQEQQEVSVPATGWDYVEVPPVDPIRPQSREWDDMILLLGIHFAREVN